MFYCHKAFSKVKGRFIFVITYQAFHICIYYYARKQNTGLGLVKTGEKFAVCRQHNIEGDFTVNAEQFMVRYLFKYAQQQLRAFW
jgi:hypothetical protein